MIIESLHLTGFGIFQDTGVTSLTRGLTIIYAANGAGKTTLRDFLRASLFGFQAKDNRYEPLGTTTHGGLLQVRDRKEQPFVIHFDVVRGRGQSRVKLPDGQDGPPLSDLLNYASPEIFRNIFTIGLPELQNTEGFNTSKEIQVMIGAFGGGHSGQSFLKWRKALEDEQIAIFRPGGQKPELNSKLSEVEKLQGQLKALQAEAEKYWGYEEEFKMLEKETSRVNRQKTDCNRRLNHLENLKKAWPDWVALCEVRRELGDLQPCVKEFPAQGLEKLDKLRERQQQQALKVKLHREAQERYQQQLDGLQVNTGLLEHSIALDEVWDRLALDRENRKRLEELERQISVRQNELQAKLAEIGSEWTLARALEFKDDVATRTEKLEIVRELSEKKQEVRHAAGELEKARCEREKLCADINRQQADFEKQWHSPPPDEETLDQLQSVLTKCRALLLEENRTRNDIKKNTDEMEECLLQLRRLEEQAALSRPTSTSGTVFLVIAVVGLAVALILAVIFRENLPAMAASIIAGIMGAALCWLLARQQRGSQPPGASYFTEQAQFQRQKQTKLEAEGARLQAVREELQTEINALRQLLGIASSDEAAYEAAETSLKKQREARRHFEREQAALADATAQAQRVKERVAALQIELADKEKQYFATAQRWQKWLAAQGLDDSLTVEAANATIEHLKKVDDLHKSLTEQSLVAGDLKAQIEAYACKCQALFDALNEAPGEAPELERQLRNLRVLREEAVENLKQRNQLKEQLKIGEQAVPALREEGRKLVQEFKELLVSGNAQDENEFIIRAQAWHKRQELQATERNLLGRLQILSAPGEALAQLQSELAGLTHEVLENRLSEAEQESVAVNGEYERLNQRLGALRGERQRLADDDEVALCAQQLEQAKAELQNLARQWAVRRLAFCLMEKARHKFETERQPAVLQSAGESLKTMSRGRYEGIMRPLGSSESHLVQPNGELRANEKIWNTALKEKVYLSLRFGLIEAYSERHEPLPVVLDDALVNLDPHNMHGAAQAILQLARKQQVIYLTCHPHTVEHFVAHDEALPVYEITEQGRFNLKNLN